MCPQQSVTQAAHVKELRVQTLLRRKDPVPPHTHLCRVKDGDVALPSRLGASRRPGKSQGVYHRGVAFMLLISLGKNRRMVLSHAAWAMSSTLAPLIAATMCAMTTTWRQSAQPALTSAGSIRPLTPFPSTNFSGLTFSTTTRSRGR